MTQHLIVVSRSELQAAIRIATVGVRGSDRSELRFSLVEGYLHVMGPGAAHSVSATGKWPSAVFANAAVLKRLRAKFPRRDPITLKVKDSKLFIESFSIPANVLDIAPSPIQMPIGATSADILVAVERYGEAVVFGSIGRGAIRNAETDLLDRVDQALIALAPFDIQQAELTNFVRRLLRKRARDGGQGAS